MFRGKLRLNTCKVIILTSIVWIFIYVVILMKHANFFNSTNHPREGRVVIVKKSEKKSSDEWNLSIPRRYQSTELREWQPPPVVPKVDGPGEMGNCTSI